jgi:hypothetical protein
MKSPRARWIRIGTLLLAVTGLGACIAPILTVPPPGAEGIAFSSTVITDADGGQRTVWTAQGGPLPEAALAKYYIFDQTVSGGVIAMARADGSFTAPEMDGTVDDHIVVYYVTPAGNYSESVCVLLSAGSSPPLCPE